MAEYNEEIKFPAGMSTEEKSALLWKIEQDYQSADMRAVSFKGEYTTFAVNFYTRNIFSLEDVVVLYRAHCKAEKRKALAAAFMADMKHNMRERQHEVLM